jgi:hypothetical protein
MTNRLIYYLLFLLLTACENSPYKLAEIQSDSSLTTEFSILDQNSISLIQRRKQQAVIEAAFSRRTSSERAHQLAEICFNKTNGSVLMPFDLAEIALVETGGHRLSSKAVSSRGALGVWQLMPRRALSHGFSPKDMLDDDKCAEAAVRELYSKLNIVKGDLERAKRYYCGQGPQATAYMKKIRLIRNEMMNELTLQSSNFASVEPATRVR